jgi:AcrR family transcriptional regulator
LARYAVGEKMAMIDRKTMSEETMTGEVTSLAERGTRDKLLEAAVGLLDADGPDVLQTRRVAGAAGTSTMAVYTHFGGMRALIAAVAEEGLRQFDAALTLPRTDDPVADLMAVGAAYRRYAIKRPHMYRLMFGSTSVHGINAPAANVLTLTVAEVEQRHPSFAHVVRGVHRCVLAGRFGALSADDDATVVATAAQFWSLIHGFVMLELAGFYGDGNEAVEPVLGAVSMNLLVALGDSPDLARKSLLG